MRKSSILFDDIIALFISIVKIKDAPKVRKFVKNIPTGYPSLSKKSKTQILKRSTKGNIW